MQSSSQIITTNKPSCRKPRPKSAYDFLGLLYCFVVLLCICVVSCPYVTYFPTIMARYCLFLLKVPLNPKQTKKNKLQRAHVVHLGTHMRHLGNGGERWSRMQRSNVSLVGWFVQMISCRAWKRVSSTVNCCC